MFTIDDKVANTGSDPVTVYPYALVSRHGIPQVKGYYILHEGLIGVVDNGLEEISYKKAVGNPPQTFKSKRAGSASPTNIGLPSSSPSRANRSRPNSPAPRATARSASRPTISWMG